MRALTLALCIATVSRLSLFAQEQSPGPDGAAQNVLTVHSSLVLVPALVKTKRGELVFSLQADDFKLLDNGVPQPVRLESDTDPEPLAMVVVVQTGGQGAAHLNDYRGLDAVLENIIGSVPHHIAVVSFDSEAHLEQGFTEDTEMAAGVIAKLAPGDPGAAILDGLKFGTDLLREEEPGYRRALLLLSETIDNGSQTSLDGALRAIGDTNTAIYTFAFSSSKAALKHEGAKLPDPFQQTEYSAIPYKKGGCMSREPSADPDSHGKRGVQALDCASDLIPPLRLARMAYIAATDAMKRNVPESVAELTGGEYSSFKDAKSLSRNLVTISNDVHNYYILSFEPNSPHSGLHALSLGLRDRPELEVKARSAYWVDAESDRP